MAIGWTKFINYLSNLDLPFPKINITYGIDSAVDDRYSHITDAKTLLFHLALIIAILSLHYIIFIV